MSTAVTPTSVRCALKTACALPASSATALRVSAISVVSGTPDLQMQEKRGDQDIFYKTGLHCQD
jgi:hypothetical protein